MPRASWLRRMAPPRRHLALVCFVRQAWRDTLDQAVDMYGKLLDRSRKLVEHRLDEKLKAQRHAVAPDASDPNAGAGRHAQGEVPELAPRSLPPAERRSLRARPRRLTPRILVLPQEPDGPRAGAREETFS